MGRMGMIKYNYLLFIYLLFLNSTLGQLSFYTSNGYWSQITLWVPPVSVPSITDNVQIYGGVTCTIDIPAYAGNITIGSATGTFGVLNVSNSITSSNTNGILVYGGSTINFNIVNSSQVINTGFLSVAGEADNYGIVYINSVTYLSNINGLFYNFGTIVFNSSLYIGEQGSYYGTHLNVIRNLIVLDDGVFGLINTAENNYIFNVDFVGGYFYLEKSYVYTEFTQIVPMTPSSIILKDYAVWEWNGTASPPKYSYGRLALNDTLFSMQSHASVFLSNVLAIFGKNANFTMNNAFFQTDYTLSFAYDSKGDIINSAIYVKGMIVLTGQASVYTENSNITVDGDFGMTGNSLFYAVNSKLMLTVPLTSILGVITDSKIIIDRGSTIFLRGQLIGFDRSSMQIWNSSTLWVFDFLILVNQTSLTVRSNSVVGVYGSIMLTHQSYLHMYNSTMFISGKVGLLDETDFIADNSIVFVNSTMVISTINYYSVFQDSILYVNDQLFLNCTMYIKNTMLVTSSSFTSIFYLYVSSSQVQVTNGSFLLASAFESYNSSFSIHGELKVSAYTVFVCRECNILIEHGEWVQDPTSLVNITDTIITNRGRVIADSNILLKDSGISNGGIFSLKADILPAQDVNISSIIISSRQLRDDINNTYKVSNGPSGEFTVNGQNSSVINVIFENQGKLSIQQDTSILSYQQVSGTLGFSNDKSLTSDEIIQISGGSIEGNGKINSPIIDNSGTLGGKNIDKITINGTYSQSEKGSFIANINENEQSTIIEVSNNVTLGGTLVIRIEESASNKQMTKQIMTYSESSGNFNNVVIKTYDKETGKETVQPDCKVKTTKSDKGFSVLLNPDPENCDPKPAKKINKGLVIGLTLGLVGGAALITTLIVFRNKIGTRVLIDRAKIKMKIFTRSN